MLINEAGVLTDRTFEFATAADDGGMGFFDLTNDRDVELTDVNNDGWPDVVTSVILGDNLPKTISHPRVYINLGKVDGQWQGLRYEERRNPQLHPTAGPRFIAVAAGDVTSDGAPDLYFVDYDLGGEMIFDFNDRPLINDGNGFFSDETDLRLTEEMTEPQFAQNAEIVDINGNGVADIVRSSNGLPIDNPTITYNDPANPGFFSVISPVQTIDGSTDATVSDMNNDRMPDIIATTDFLDVTACNLGARGDNQPEFAINQLPTSTGGFGGESVAADLNHDGWNDLFITDVDFEIPGCNRTSDILQSNADPPFVTFRPHDGGNIPDDMLNGVHEVAVFDINNDSFLDLVIGRCESTQIWIFEPAPCPGDFKRDNTIDGADLGGLLGAWNGTDETFDLNRDGTIDGSDLGILLGTWGDCPQ